MWRARLALHVLPFCKDPVVMSGCFVDERSCSGAGPGGKVSRVLANSPSHRLARNVDRKFCVESVSVRERRCWGSLLASVCGDIR